MSSADAPTPLVHAELEDALQRFRALERTLRRERESIGREMVAVTAARTTRAQAATVSPRSARVASPSADAEVHGVGAAGFGAAHVVIARWGDQLCSHCAAALTPEQARRRRCPRCRVALHFDRAAAPNSPTRGFPCPTCSKLLVGVGPGQPCYHCGHRLPQTFLKDMRRREAGG